MNTIFRFVFRMGFFKPIVFVFSPISNVKDIGSEKNHEIEGYELNYLLWNASFLLFLPIIICPKVLTQFYFVRNMDLLSRYMIIL